MTKAEENCNAAPNSSSTPDGEKKKDKDKPPSKIVIRRLPPSLTPEDFLEQVSPLPDHDFFYFVRADKSLGANAFTRAYINFLNAEDIFIFRDKFDGYVFLDAKGGEYPAIVEFSPFLKVPKKKQRKPDSKCGILEQDSDYKKFLEMLTSQTETEAVSLDAIVEEVEAKELRQAKMATSKTSTPLLEFLKRRKEERRMNTIKMRDDRRRGGREKDYDRKRRDDFDRKDRDHDRDHERDRERVHDLERDRIRERERRKEKSRAKERERRRDRGDLLRAGQGKERQRQGSQGSSSGKFHEEKSRPVTLLKKTSDKERDVSDGETEAAAPVEQARDRVEGGRGSDSWEKSRTERLDERKARGDKGWRGDQPGRDKRKEWDDQAPRSGQERGGGGGRRREGKGFDERRKGEEWREKGKYREDGKGGKVGRGGGKGGYREEENYSSRRDKKWEERGGRERYGKERDREIDREKRDGDGYGKEIDREKRGGDKYGNERDREMDREKRSGDRYGKNRDREMDREKRGGDRYGKDRERRDGERGSGAKDRFREDNRQVEEGGKSRTEWKDGGKRPSQKEGGDGGRSGERDARDRAKESDGTMSTECGGSGEKELKTSGKKLPRDGGKEREGQAQEDTKDRRKERPERQIYIPRRALERNRQDSPQPSEGGATKGT